MDKNLGKVLTGSTTDQFEIASLAPILDEYVEVDLSSEDGGPGIIIGRVLRCETRNPYFAERQIIHYLSKAGDEFSIHTSFHTVAEPIAVVTGNDVRRSRVPARPGMTVRAASKTLISAVLGTDAGGITIGHTRSPDPVVIAVDPQRILRTHVAVIGHTGAGKSWLTLHVLQQMVRLNIAEVLVIDPSGEYAESDNGRLFAVQEIASLCYPLSIPFLRSVFDLTRSQCQWIEDELSGPKQVRLALEGNGDSLTRGALAGLPCVRTGEIAKRAAEAGGRNTDLAAKLAGVDVCLSPNPTQLWSESRAHVLSGAGASDEEIDFASAYVLHQLVDRRKDADRRPMVVVLEEAHNLAPSQTAARAKRSIVRLAREGRKMGVCLWLVTQRPRHVDPTVLSQCGTMFLFRVQNADDIRHLLEFSPFAPADMPGQLPGLWVGECAVIGDALNVPTVCRVQSER